MNETQRFSALSGLARRMRTSRAIGFVGAGASKHSGYPLWPELLDNLRIQLERHTSKREVESLVDKNIASRDPDPRWVAEVYTAALENRINREEAIDQALISGGPTGPAEIHDLLARLPFRQFITTNYDELIERACDDLLKGDEPRCKPFSAVRGDGFNGFLQSFAADSDRRSVLHLHGIVNEEMTLALSDYDAQYLGEGMLLRMYTIFATSTVVFVGTSLTDVDLMQMIRRAHWHGDRRTRHYAFLPEGEEDRAKALEYSYGIQGIFYRVGTTRSGAPDHSDLNRTLSHLLELTEALEGDEIRRPSGNRQPVIPDSDQQPWERSVEELELEVKDLIRPPAEERPIVAIYGVPPTDSDTLLRRIAVDYRKIPARFGFTNVIWLSPKRIGLFPSTGSATPPPRSVADAVLGEMTRVLGEHRMTATLDDALNQQQLSSVLERNKTLLVLAGARALYEAACRRPRCKTSSSAHACGRRRLGDLLSGFPKGSVALIAADEPVWEDDPYWRTIPLVREPDRDNLDVVSEPRRGQATFAERLASGEWPLHSEVLAALAVLAGPIASDELAARLHRSPADLETVVEELAAENLLETGVRHDAIGVARRMHELDVTDPVRRATLGATMDSSEFADAFRATVRHLSKWAGRTVASLRHWHYDNAQYERLNQLLPDLMTIFEAGCWMPPTDRADVDRQLELGIELATALYRTGRWAEAHSYCAYLDGAAQKRRSSARTDVRLLRSRGLSIAHLSDDDLVDAERLARHVARLESATPVQRRRAQVRMAIAQFRRGDVEEARRTAEPAWKQSWRAYEKDPRERRLLEVAEEAAGVYVEARLASLEALAGEGAPSRRSLPVLLRVLDRRSQLLDALRSNREKGHNWRLRGDVLQAYGQLSSARRYFARALVVSHEFRDRLLEARARLGIGVCDQDAHQADLAADGFHALRMGDEVAAARRTAKAIRLAEAAGRAVPSAPSLILVLGSKHSGRSTTLEVAHAYLGRLGFDPLNRTAELGEWPNDPNQVHVTLAKERKKAAEGRGERAVLLAKVDQDEPSDLFDEPNERKALCGSLLLHLEPREQTGRQRTPWLAAPSIPITNSSRPTGFYRWDSALEYHDVSYVAIDSNVEVIHLESKIQEVLSFSYLPVDDLLEQNRTWENFER